MYYQYFDITITLGLYGSAKTCHICIKLDFSIFIVLHTLYHLCDLPIYIQKIGYTEKLTECKYLLHLFVQS